MDVDITDILASIGRDLYNEDEPLRAGRSENVRLSRHRRDLHSLVHIWTSERAAPELLPYPAELMQRVMARIRQQIEILEERTSRMDAGTSFGLVIIQTELERIKFLMRSLLRTRTTKIDLFPLLYLSSHTSRTHKDGSTLLSTHEVEYVHRHMNLAKSHYSTSFLSVFPWKLQHLDDMAGSGFAGMVETPDTNTAVFVRCLGMARNGHDTDQTALLRKSERHMTTAGVGNGAGQVFDPVQVSCGFTLGLPENAEVNESSTNTSHNGVDNARVDERVVWMKRNEDWIVRWGDIKSAVVKGECNLL